MNDNKRRLLTSFAKFCVCVRDIKCGHFVNIDAIFEHLLGGRTVQVRGRAVSRDPDRSRDFMEYVERRCWVTPSDLWLYLDKTQPRMVPK